MGDTPLRSGYTTGTCAAAAAKAAALCLRGMACDAVQVTLPDGGTATLAVEAAERLSDTTARAAVIKDAGDDPDVTHGMTVLVTLELGGAGIVFAAGDGVGTVTKAGLQLAPGEPAINPGPRAMIAGALAETLGDAGCRVTVSIPGGADVAARTFNPRLGIAGGLSVLGTTGRVEPKSEEAWLRSLLPQLDVARAAGHTTIYLTPGGFGETAAREALGAPPEAVANTANFIGDMLRACAERGAEAAVLVGHAGKLVKVAAGIFNTHSRFGDARLETIAAVAAAEGAPAPLVAALLDLPTAEAAVPLLADAGLTRVWHAVAARAAARATQHAGIPVRAVFVDYQGAILGDSAASFMREGGVTVVGVGPGAATWLSPAAWAEVRGADVVVAGKRHLAAYAPADAVQVPIGADIAVMVAAMRAQLGKRIVVLASGDPGCYGVLATLKRELPDVPLRVLPGISSFQLALARLAEPWEGVHFASAHGRPVVEVVEAAWRHPRVLALTDHAHPAHTIAAALVDEGLDYPMVVLERLGYPDERVTAGTASEIAAGTFDPLAVVWITRP
jgi:cobalt-precorrin-5B (C1)-methyltransferase